MSNRETGNDQTLSISNQKGEIQSFGLEFGPNFFAAHFYADHSGEHFLHTETTTVKQWDGFTSQIRNIPMPLFAILHTACWTLVPTSIFDEDHAAEFLNFNTSPKTGQPISFDHILPLDAVLIYQSELETESFLDTHYPGLGIRHGAGVLLEMIERIQRKKPQTATYIFQLGQYYQVSVYKNGKLMLTNAIEAAHLEDIRYYVLFTQKQLNIDPSHPVHTIGEAASNVALKLALGKFCPKVENLRFTGTPEQVNSAANSFIGLNAHLCV
jgi:hypothetical protein